MKRPPKRATVTDAILRRHREFFVLFTLASNLDREPGDCRVFRRDAERLAAGWDLSGLALANPRADRRPIRTDGKRVTGTRHVAASACRRVSLVA